MRTHNIGGPFPNMRGSQDRFEPVLCPVADTDEEIAELWAKLGDGVDSLPPEKTGMYVPWIAWRDRTYYMWAGVQTRPNVHGKAWLFYYPRVPELAGWTTEQVRHMIRYAQRNYIVWVRSIPTDL